MENAGPSRRAGLENAQSHASDLLFHFPALGFGPSFSNPEIRPPPRRGTRAYLGSFAPAPLPVGVEGIAPIFNVNK